MIDTFRQTERTGSSGRRINRAPSPILSYGLPWASVLLASLAVFSPLIPSALIAPPLSYLVFISWRLLRPGLFPVWAGFPLGLFDDLYSGLPFGSAALLWSITMAAMEAVESRFPVRHFTQDWLLAGLMTALYLVVTTVLANLGGGATSLSLIAPQLFVSLLAVPIVARLVAWLDHVRLTRLTTA